jgi:hypothetical protein
MKVKNFPGRKNTRRLAELDRLNRRHSFLSIQPNPIDNSKRIAKTAKEIAILEKKILAPEDAVNILTKKSRAKR